MRQWFRVAFKQYLLLQLIERQRTACEFQGLKNTSPTFCELSMFSINVYQNIDQQTNTQSEIFKYDGLPFCDEL